jgi:hypothetical protein
MRGNRYYSVRGQVPLFGFMVAIQMIFRLFHPSQSVISTPDSWHACHVDKQIILGLKKP